MTIGKRLSARVTTSFHRRMRFASREARGLPAYLWSSHPSVGIVVGADRIARTSDLRPPKNEAHAPHSFTQVGRANALGRHSPPRSLLSSEKRNKFESSSSGIPQERGRSVIGSLHLSPGSAELRAVSG
jgi:hypothetical protein